MLLALVALFRGAVRKKRERSFVRFATGSQQMRKAPVINRWRAHCKEKLEGALRILGAWSAASHPDDRRSHAVQRAKSICILERVSVFQQSFISRLRGCRPETQQFIAWLTDTDLIHIKGGCARTP